MFLTIFARKQWSGRLVSPIARPIDNKLIIYPFWTVVTQQGIILRGCFFLTKFTITENNDQNNNQKWSPSDYQNQNQIIIRLFRRYAFSIYYVFLLRTYTRFIGFLKGLWTFCALKRVYLWCGRLTFLTLSTVLDKVITREAISGISLAINKISLDTVTFLWYWVWKVNRVGCFITC